MEEIWKSVIWYKWRYEVSNYWNIKTLCDRYWNVRLLKPQKHWKCKRYRAVRLTDNKWIRSNTIHRLVAKAFIRNPKWKRTVNHIDWNPSNNCVTNLEWATDWENQKHAYNNWLKIVTKKNNFVSDNPNKWKFWSDNKSAKKVWQYTLDWELINVWDSVIEAKIITKVLWIQGVATGNRKTAWGFKWKYL